MATRKQSKKSTVCGSPTTTKKSPSFSDPYADVTLVSSDDIDFHVMKGILVITSFFFREMFALPQPTNDKEELQEKEESPTSVALISKPRLQSLPRVQVSEDSQTLDFLLCTIYPVPSPTLDMKTNEGAELANKVLEAALKYDMDLVKSQICSALISSALATSKSTEPSPAVRIYAIACHHGMRDVARDAARACLHGSIINEYFPELETITAGAYFRLQQYQRAVTAAVSELINTLTNFGMPQDMINTISCRGCNMQNSSRWWDHWKKGALSVIEKAPLSEDIFSSSFVMPALTKATNECSYCANSAHGKWHTARDALMEGITAASTSIEIDLSRI